MGKRIYIKKWRKSYFRVKKKKLCEAENENIHAIFKSQNEYNQNKISLPSFFF